MPPVTPESPLEGVVGSKVATSLSRAFGMATVGDLLDHYQRRYARRGELTPIEGLPVGELVTIVAQVRAVSLRPMKQRKGALLEVVISDGVGAVSLTFFNQAWRQDTLRVGRQGIF